MYFKEQATILLWTITVTYGERWYSASLLNSEIDFPEINFGPSGYKWVKNNLINVNHEPSNTVRAGNHTKWSDWNFMRKHEVTVPSPVQNDNDNSKLKLISKLKNLRSSTKILKNNTEQDNGNNIRNKTPVYKINNTIQNVNVIRRSKPKRRVVQKRCPTIRPRRGKQLNVNPKQRFLEVFEVVEFDHVPCTSSSGLEGTCLPENECLNSGGTTMGSCADGYGTCCVTQFSCEERTAAATGWFTNPGFPDPNTDRLSCTLTLDKTSGDIQQIRLDFMNFELLPPTDGTCEQDQFVVSGQNTNTVVPILCGVNTGQHVYIEVGNSDGPITLSVQTVSSDTRLFSIKITQLGSGDELAPSACLQYYKGSQGYFESFNYRDKSEIAISRLPSYLNNLNYAICIERSPTTCSITYTNTGAMQIVNYDNEGLPVIPPAQAGVETFNCPTDWLLMAAIRLCGERLNDGSVLQDFSLDAPVTDISSGPIVVWFRSDGGYVGRGFKIQYQQNECQNL